MTWGGWEGGLVVTFMRIDDRCFLPFLSIEYLYTIFFSYVNNTNNFGGKREFLIEFVETQ